MSNRSLNAVAETITAPASVPLSQSPDKNSLSISATSQSISVVGLGYVGSVSVACLASLGHRMMGVDIAEEKVRQIKQGRAPIVEARLGDLLAEGVVARRIDATTDLAAAVRDTDVTFLSVGTPTAKDGGCDLTYVQQASRAIGESPWPNRWTRGGHRMSAWE